MLKASEILNGQLNRVLSEMGHTDELVITDAGLPIPKGVERIDLAVIPNMPPFLTVLASILQHLTVQGAVVSADIVERNPALWGSIRTLVPPGIPFDLIEHTAFKERLSSVRAAVRTGEFSWYANIILIGGVSF